MLVTYAASIESLYIHWITTGAQESLKEIADMFLVIRGFIKNLKSLVIITHSTSGCLFHLIIETSESNGAHTAY